MVALLLLLLASLWLVQSVSANIITDFLYGPVESNNSLTHKGDFNKRIFSDDEFPGVSQYRHWSIAGPQNVETVYQSHPNYSSSIYKKYMTGNGSITQEEYAEVAKAIAGKKEHDNNKNRIDHTLHATDIKKDNIIDLENRPFRLNFDGQWNFNNTTTNDLENSTLTFTKTLIDAQSIVYVYDSTEDDKEEGGQTADKKNTRNLYIEYFLRNGKYNDDQYLGFKTYGYYDRTTKRMALQLFYAFTGMPEVHETLPDDVKSALGDATKEFPNQSWLKYNTDAFDKIAKEDYSYRGQNADDNNVCDLYFYGDVYPKTRKTLTKIPDYGAVSIDSYPDPENPKLEYTLGLRGVIFSKRCAINMVVDTIVTNTTENIIRAYIYSAIMIVFCVWNIFESAHLLLAIGSPARVERIAISSLVMILLLDLLNIVHSLNYVSSSFQLAIIVTTLLHFATCVMLDGQIVMIRYRQSLARRQVELNRRRFCSFYCTLFILIIAVILVTFLIPRWGVFAICMIVSSYTGAQYIYAIRKDISRQGFTWRYIISSILSKVSPTIYVFAVPNYMGLETHWYYGAILGGWHILLLVLLIIQRFTGPRCQCGRTHKVSTKGWRYEDKHLPVAALTELNRDWTVDIKEVIKEIKAKNKQAGFPTELKIKITPSLLFRYLALPPYNFTETIMFNLNPPIVCEQGTGDTANETNYELYVRHSDAKMRERAIEMRREEIAEEYQRVRHMKPVTLPEIPPGEVVLTEHEKRLCSFCCNPLHPHSVFYHNQLKPEELADVVPQLSDSFRMIGKEALKRLQWYDFSCFTLVTAKEAEEGLMCSICLDSINMKTCQYQIRSIFRAGSVNKPTPTNNGALCIKLQREEIRNMVQVIRNNTKHFQAKIAGHQQSKTTQQDKIPLQLDVSDSTTDLEAVQSVTSTSIESNLGSKTSYNIDDVHTVYYGDPKITEADLPLYERILGEKNKLSKKYIDVSMNFMGPDSEQTLWVTACGHNFHKKCLSQWLEENVVCCIDRQPLATPIEQQ